MKVWALVVILLLASLLGGCVVADTPSTATLDAPTWERVALGTGGADFVGAVDLDAVRADPLFGPLVEQFARKDDVRALSRASQIDLVASVVDGEPASWIAVVHGVDGPPGEKDAAGLGKILSVRGAWIVGEGAAFRRVRADTSLAPGRVAMPARALLAATIQGRAVPRPRHPELVDTTEGLRDATLEILGGRHLEVIMTCRYVDATAARHGATAARLLLVAAAARLDNVSALARALTKVDFDVSGTEVSVRVTVSDDLRELLQDYVARAARGGD